MKNRRINEGWKVREILFYPWLPYVFDDALFVQMRNRSLADSLNTLISFPNSFNLIFICKMRIMHSISIYLALTTCRTLWIVEDIIVEDIKNEKGGRRDRCLLQQWCHYFKCLQLIRSACFKFWLLCGPHCFLFMCTLGSSRWWWMHGLRMWVFAPCKWLSLSFKFWLLWLFGQWSTKSVCHLNKIKINNF